MSEWAEITLGDLFRVDNAKLGTHTIEPTVLSISKYEGFVRADEYFDKRIASAKLDGYKVVEPGDWAFSTIHIDEGSIARNNLGEVGVISPMYTTMRWVAQNVLPSFGELLVKQPGMLAEYGNRAQGSINRRRSLPFKSFAAIPISLPSLAEQRRILDVMAAVDAQIEALGGEVDRNGRAYRAFLAGLSEAAEWRRIEGVVVAAFAGGTPPRDRPDYYGGDIPWLKSGEVEGDDIQTTAESITAAGLLASSAKLVPVGATIVAMYGQGHTKGRAGFVGAPITTNQAVLALVPDESVVTPRFLLHSIRSQTVALRARAIGAAQPNLSKGLVMRQKIPVYGSLVEQQTFSGAADLLRTSGIALLRELTDLRTFRSTLLASLLTRDVQIPESYDAVLAVELEVVS